MKTFKKIGAIVSVVALVGLPAIAQDSHHTSRPHQTEAGDMSDLLKRLRHLTDQAERSRAANPAFIKDLRNLADEYDNPWPVKVFYDDFRDGDFTRNPAWTVVAGDWRLDTKGRLTGLHSVIAKPRAERTQSGSSGAGPSEIVGNVLGGFLKEQQDGQGNRGDRRSGRGERDQHATIFAPVSISNAFAIRLELASGEGGGRFDFGPTVGQRGDSLYRITYRPDAESGLVLSRVTNQGTQLLASSNGRVILEDDKSHVIEWQRDRAGKMTVALDGKQMFETVDGQISSRFDGFLMDNSGGAYWIHSVAIAGTK
jgi:hypothetical protein